MTLTVQARFTTVHGRGVGRWRNYYRAEDLENARWAARQLVPKAQVRVRDQTGALIVTPRRVEEWLD